MFENIVKFFKKLMKMEDKELRSKDSAKERLQLVLMQDRANVSAEFLDLMKQEIIEVIKKYIDVDENAIDVRLTNIANEDGTNGSPALYANIPIVSIKEETKKIKLENETESEQKPGKKEEIKKEETSESKENSNNKEEEKAKNEDKTEKKEETIQETKNQKASEKENKVEEKNETDENHKEEIEENKTNEKEDEKIKESEEIKKNNNE